jgi:hypothetical protein
MTKPQYIKRTFAKIRARRLREPIQLNTGTTIPDLERYLATIERGILGNDNPKIERLFIYKLETLLKLKL